MFNSNNKNTKSTMGEFLPESTASSVLPVFKSNTPFIINDHGRRVYIGMMLDVTTIGGISKKTINDKDKGGVIELIKNGRVDAYITAELNDENKLLFIPKAETTIDRLGDYGMFRTASYEFVKLNDKLEIIERTGIMESYGTFRAIATGSEDINNFVKPADIIEAGSKNDPTVSGFTQAVNKAQEMMASVAEKAAPVTDKIKDTVAPAVSKIAEKAKEKFAESAVVKDMQPAGAPAENPKQEEKPAEAAPVQEEKPQEKTDNQSVQPQKQQTPEEDTEDVVYTETQVLASVNRIFHADNLELPLSSEPFDQLFTINNHLIRFDIDSRDTYVNERLNLMAVSANRDLEKLRSDNLRKLREKYFQLMSSRILEIQKSTDIKNEATEYGRLKHDIDVAKSEAINSMADLIAEKQKELEDDYNKRLEEYCEKASRDAASAFKQRYAAPHSNDMSNVERAVRADIETNYTVSMNNLYMQRRSDALTTLDYNTTYVLQELAGDYEKMFEAENALYTEKAKEIRDYAKELHQEDARRLAVEEEHNRISNEVNDARAEASAKIEFIKKDYEAASQAAEARYQATITNAENKTQLIQEQMEARTLTLMQDKDVLQKQLDAAIERADKATEIVKADYEHRLIQAQDDRDSWKQTLDAYKEQHKHNNMLAAILVIAIVIAAIAGGFVAGGVYWNRVVAGELASNENSGEIKIISPQTAETESSDETKAFDVIDGTSVDTEAESAVTDSSEEDNSAESDATYGDTDSEETTAAEVSDETTAADYID